MWKVEFESLEVQAEVDELKKSKLLSEEDEAIISAWIRQVSYYGPLSVQKQKSWNDHALSNDWLGYRSSSFSNRGLSIYRIEDRVVKIKIARITNTHNYKKGAQR